MGSVSAWLPAILVLLLATISTTLAQELQTYTFGGTIDLSPIAQSAVLTPAAIVDWQDETAAFYTSALENRLDLDPPIIDPIVTVSLLFAARPGEDGSGSVLAMQYRARVSFRSNSNSYDPGILALPAFRDQAAVLQYVVSLAETGHDIFQGISSLSLVVQPATLVENPATPAPTGPPVETPAPTPSPVVAPTPAPSLPALSLTAAPVVVDEVGPTPSPVTVTDPPILIPDVDVVLPDDPTDPPTRAPVDPPTRAPGPPPTNFPTPPPAPTAAGLQTTFTTTELIFKTLPSTMQGSILEDWKTATAGYLSDYIQALVDEDLLAASPLRIEKILQEEENRRRQRLLRKKNRDLQDEDTIANATTIPTMEVGVEFVSRLALPPNLDANSLVNGAFLTRSRREAYRQWILDNVQENPDSAAFFASLVEVTFVDGNGNTNSNQNPTTGDGKDDKKGDDGIRLGLIIGIVAGVLVLAILAFCIYKRSSNSGSGKDTTSSNGGIESEQVGHTHNMSPNSNGGIPGATAGNGTGMTWEPADQPSRLNQEIVVGDGMDDVSTIGDPYLYGQPAGIQEDERTATTSVFQTEAYNSLLGRERALSHERSTADDTEFSAFTGVSRYLGPNTNAAPKRSTLLGELGIAEMDETSFEQRLFPIEKEEEGQSVDEVSLDYSLPTALM